MELLPYNQHPRYIIFSDFDETYYPHQITTDLIKDRLALEDFLSKHSANGNILFGVITGSSIQSVYQKMDRAGYRYYPHFIASDLGTEITYYNADNIGAKDKVWLFQNQASGYSFEKVSQLIAQLKKEDILLVSQIQSNASEFMHSFYYYAENEKLDMKRMQRIKQIAFRSQINVNINRCNPLAGDPENAYDINFSTPNTGKKEIVHYILDKFSITKERAIAFGDSGNDLSMLNAVKYGYLVENATKEAKESHQNITEGAYTAGILSILNYFDFSK